MNNCYVGIDLGGTRIKIGLVTDGSVTGKTIISPDQGGTLLKNLEMIRPEIDKLIGKGIKLAGIGMGFPGLVDPVAKKIISTNKKYDDAPDTDINGWIRDNWDVPFIVENDARLAAMGEWKFGAARDTDNFVSLTIGTGVGAAVVMEGKLLRGKHFQAGCLGGHLSINYHGRKCTCGNTGCLEAYAASWSIKERLSHDPRFKESKLSAFENIDFESLFTAAREHDPLAVEMRQDCLDAWAAGIVNLIHAYDPDVVILGGGAMNNHAEILPYLKNKVRDLAWTPWGEVDIRTTGILSNAGILGAAYCLQNDI